MKGRDSQPNVVFEHGKYISKYISKYLSKYIIKEICRAKVEEEQREVRGGLLCFLSDFHLTS